MSGSSPGTTFYLLREIYSKYYMQKKRVCTVSNNSTPFIFRTYHWFHLYDVIFTIFTYYRTNEQRAQLYKLTIWRNRIFYSIFYLVYNVHKQSTQGDLSHLALGSWTNFGLKSKFQAVIKWLFIIKYV